MAALTSILITLVRLAAAFALLLTLLSFGGQFNYWLDNLANFRLQFAYVLVACSIVLWMGESRTVSLVVALGAVVNLVPILTWYLAGFSVTPVADNGSVRVLVSNVYRRNMQYDRLSRLIEEEDPDIVGLIEVDKRWLSNVQILGTAYPYRFEAPSDRYVGLALYSKIPIEDAHVEEFGEGSPQAIVTTLFHDDQRVEFILAHPLPPMTAKMAAQRNLQLRLMAEYVRNTAWPVILAGDLNITMWSPHYAEFTRAAGLQNARAGRGIAPTWPPLPILGIPIDHILSTNAVRIEDFQVLGSVGSDHLPITASITFPESAKSSVVARAAKQ